MMDRKNKVFDSPESILKVKIKGSDMQLRYSIWSNLYSVDTLENEKERVE